ncbi:MAG: hypothetical protein QS721_12440 [Candidatus Endonucleobacter sp. (ex Gigantidas childressi)]|nr:hypothetical protein [Candidatus Endonucleobacter sp. (ex Gigantidas childressi)]
MQKEIAVSVGISESALSRELSHNANDDGYGAESAHALASQRRVTATKFSKTDERHMPIIKKKKKKRGDCSVLLKILPARGC